MKAKLIIIMLLLSSNVFLAAKPIIITEDKAINKILLRQQTLIDERAKTSEKSKEENYKGIVLGLVSCLAIAAAMAKMKKSTNEKKKKITS